METFAMARGTKAAPARKPILTLGTASTDAYCERFLLTAQEHFPQFTVVYSDDPRATTEPPLPGAPPLPATPSELMAEVAKLREKLRGDKSRELLNLTKGPIERLWQAMHEIGGKPVPPIPAWAEYGTTKQDFADVLLGRSPANAPSVDAVNQALQTIEGWCGELTNKPMAINSAMKPKWDESQKSLFVGNECIKTYSKPATNQILILKAFEEQEWRPTIDDPLPRDHRIEPKGRLSDAIKSLNKAIPQLKFRGNGKGTGVTWEPSS